MASAARVTTTDWSQRLRDLTPLLVYAVTRDGNHVTVSFDVPPELEDEWAGQLVLLLNSPAGPPEANTYDITRPGGAAGVPPAAPAVERD